MKAATATLFTAPIQPPPKDSFAISFARLSLEKIYRLAESLQVAVFTTLKSLRGVSVRNRYPKENTQMRYYFL